MANTRGKVNLQVILSTTKEGLSGGIPIQYKALGIFSLALALAGCTTSQAGETIASGSEIYQQIVSGIAIQPHSVDLKTYYTPTDIATLEKPYPDYTLEGVYNWVGVDPNKKLNPDKATPADYNVTFQTYNFKDAAGDTKNYVVFPSADNDYSSPNKLHKVEYFAGWELGNNGELSFNYYTLDNKGQAVSFLSVDWANVTDQDITFIKSNPSLEALMKKANSVTMTNQFTNQELTASTQSENASNSQLLDAIGKIIEPDMVAQAAGLPSQKTPDNQKQPAPSVPMIEVTDTTGSKISVPDILTMAKDSKNYPEVATLVNKTIEQYAKAIGIKPEDVGNLTPTLQIGADGKQYVLFSDKNGNNLLIGWQTENKTWNWDMLTAKYSENLNHFSVGTSIDGYEGAINNQTYRNTAGEFFSSLYLGGEIVPKNIQSGGWNAGIDAKQLAASNNQILYLHPGFYLAAETNDIKKGSVDTIKTYVDARIDKLLDLVDTTSGKPTFLNFVNEASWDYNGNVGLFDDKDPNTPNPFLRAYGKDWVSELYVKIYNKAKDRNILVGKDLILIDNEAGMYFKGKKVDLMTSYLLKQKQLIANKLNIPINQVNLGVGIEMHMSPNPDGSNYFKIPTDQEFLDALNQLSQVGEIHITEADVKGVSHDEEIKYLLHFMQLARQSGKVRGMDFFETFRFGTPYDKSSPFENGPNGLFNQDFTPTQSYYNLLKLLFPQH